VVVAEWRVPDQVAAPWWRFRSTQPRARQQPERAGRRRGPL